MSNQAWHITSPGVLSLQDLGPSLLKPGKKQVLIRIHAAAYNYKDKLVVDHSPHYPFKAKVDLVPCLDGAGVVEEAGPCSVWKKGDRVLIHPTSWLNGSDPR